jgi:hypothetical protein
MQALRARLTDKDTLNRQSLQDHCEMLRLVKAGQTAALLRLIREHIRMTAQSSLELLANNLLLRGDRSRNRSGKIQRDPRRTAGGKRLNHTHSETEDRDSRSTDSASAQGSMLAKLGASNDSGNARTGMVSRKTV